MTAGASSPAANREGKTDEHIFSFLVIAHHIHHLQHSRKPHQVGISCADGRPPRSSAHHLRSLIDHLNDDELLAMLRERFVRLESDLHWIGPDNLSHRPAAMLDLRNFHVHASSDFSDFL